MNIFHDVVNIAFKDEHSGNYKLLLYETGEIFLGQISEFATSQISNTIPIFSTQSHSLRFVKIYQIV